MPRQQPQLCNIIQRGVNTAPPLLAVLRQTRGNKRVDQTDSCSSKLHIQTNGVGACVPTAQRKTWGRGRTPPYKYFSISPYPNTPAFADRNRTLGFPDEYRVSLKVVSNNCLFLKQTSVERGHKQTLHCSEGQLCGAAVPLSTLSTCRCTSGRNRLDKNG